MCDEYDPREQMGAKDEELSGCLWMQTLELAVNDGRTYEMVQAEHVRDAGHDVVVVC